MTINCVTFAPSAQDYRLNDEPLWQFLQSHATTPIRIDLSAVSEMTAMRLQLLISAHKQWRAEGQPMVIAGMSDALRASVAQLGVPEGFFEQEIL